MSHSDHVHLVGSVPLPDCEQVFRRLSGALGPHLSRIPDGETGERARWIYFQRTMLEQHPAMETDPTVPKLRLTQWDGKLLRETPLLRFKPGIDPDAVAFDTGYDRAAIHSYGIFRRLRDENVIPPGVRLQVALPTPIASGTMYVSPKARDAYLRVYEGALLKALASIVSAIPAVDLAIQIDVCQEVSMSARRYWSSRTTFPSGRRTSRRRSSRSSGAWAMPCRRASRRAIICATARLMTSTWCSLGIWASSPN